jgi:hypothetical protein
MVLFNGVDNGGHGWYGGAEAPGAVERLEDELLTVGGETKTGEACKCCTIHYEDVEARRVDGDGSVVVL